MPMMMLARTSHRGPWHIISGVDEYGGEHTYCGRFGFNYTLMPSHRARSRRFIEPTCKGCHKSVLHSMDLGAGKEFTAGIPVGSNSYGTGVRYY